MKQIFAICATLLILLAAVVGCLYIFDMMTFDASTRMVLKFGAAIALLGVCAALIKFLVSRTKKQQD